VGTAITVSALPGMLLALVVATAVHVVMRFQEERVTTPDPMAAMRVTLPAVTIPVLLTSATTAVGFDSLTVAFLEPVKHLGLFASLGMGYACLICLTVVPIILVAFPPRRHQHLNPWLERPLLALADFNARHHRAILVTSAALAIFGAAGLMHLRPQGTNLNYLPADSAPVRAMRFIEDHFGGAGTIDVLVSGAPDVVKDPGTATTVNAVQELLSSYPYVTTTIAYTDLLRRMNQALHDGDPAFYRVPSSTAGIAQELLLYETSGGADLPTLVDVSGYDVARVRGFTTSFMGMDENERFFHDLRSRLAHVVPTGDPPLRVELSGDWPLWLRMNLSLMDTMQDSFALTFVGVTIMMIWLVRSVRLGLLAMIPNVLPVLLAIGTLGWAGVELDFATVMIAGIALGIAVDDTIHYLSRLREELGTTGDPVLAMRRTHATVGQAMVTTAVVLFLGMGSMITSSFPPHRTFAVVIALTMAVAVLGDLLVLPALLHATGLVPRPRAVRGRAGSAIARPG
jgi:predicted RND superfamily exporter protein